MNILITAGGGYIARNLFEQLSARYTIYAPNSKELNLLETEKVYELLRAKKFDVVVHTATYDPAPRHSTKDPAKVLENNLKMFFNIARCNKHFGKMIYFGSGAEFGRENWKAMMNEEYFDNHVPSDQYGLSKYVMTRHAMTSDNIYNLRIFSVFGKYEDWRYRFISRACCRALFDLPIHVMQNARYDQMFIDDLVSVVQWFCENTPHRHVYNICSGKGYEFSMLAEIVARISGKQTTVSIDNKIVTREYGGDNSMLLAEMKDFRFTPIDEAIKNLYNWYAINLSTIDKNEL